MDNIIHSQINEFSKEHISRHEGYEFYRRALVPMGGAERCCVYVYEIPPGKSAYPYHYHVVNEESFYIISGQGVLKTPQGEKMVKAGDFLFFPANENGAHKLTNSSETDMLVYLDFDTTSELETAVYPDSGKIGVWGKDINQLFYTNTAVGYFEGE